MGRHQITLMDVCWLSFYGCRFLLSRSVGAGRSSVGLLSGRVKITWKVFAEAMVTVDITAQDSVRYIRKRLASSVQINAHGARGLLSFDHLKHGVCLVSSLMNSVHRVCV